MIMRSSHGWQLILADLSLILFLVTLTALVGSSLQDASDPEIEPETAPNPAPYLAPSQALFRKIEGGPDLGDWLREQPLDPRASLTIVAQHGPGDEEAIWQEAQAMAQIARRSKVSARVVIKGADTSDLYASLAYDTFETIDREQ